MWWLICAPECSNQPALFIDLIIQNRKQQKKTMIDMVPTFILLLLITLIHLMSQVMLLPYQQK